MKALVRLAEGYRARFHPIALIKKQVSCGRLFGGRVCVPASEVQGSELPLRADPGVGRPGTPTTVRHSEARRRMVAQVCSLFVERAA